MKRWLKFNAVGLMGVGVQLAVLALLVRLGTNYLAATALAVEAALLHNYAWHSRWTWRERPGSLWRFHLSNGVLSICGNLILMRALAGWLALPVLPANLLAIASLSLVNFWMGERWVFSGRTKNVLMRARRSGLRQACCWLLSALRWPHHPPSTAP